MFRYRRHYKTLLLLLFSAGSIIIFHSCLKSDKPGIPQEVVEVIQQTGFNRIELTKTIGNYLRPEDSLKLKAAYFLISNMPRQYSIDFSLKDSLGNEISYNPQTISTEDEFLSYWDNLEDQLGGVSFEAEKFTLDRDTIEAETLIETINLAIETRSYPWSLNYSFDDFLIGVLPYRIGNEHIEQWRPFLKDWFLPLLPEKIKHDPREVAHWVNNYINDNFRFDIRYIKKSEVQPIRSMFAAKAGNYQDLSYLKVNVLRSLGIPSYLNYIPYFADSTYSYYFVSFLNTEHKYEVLPHKGHELLLEQTNRIPKIYRRTILEMKTGLFAQKNIEKTTPPFLGHYHYEDVTSMYLGVENITFNGECYDSLVYLTVFNDKKWRAIDWAICKNDQAIFQSVSKPDNYRFAFLPDSSKTLQFLIEDTPIQLPVTK